MSEHTALPWKLCGANGGRCQCHFIWSEPTDCVVAMSVSIKDEGITAGEGVTEEAACDNAAFIVKACNSHKRLVEACKALLKIYRLYRPQVAGTDAVEEYARAALAPVEETPVTTHPKPLTPCQ